MDQAIYAGLNGLNFDSLSASAQSALEYDAFQNVFGDSAFEIFALHAALQNRDILAETIETTFGGSQAAAQQALNNAKNNPAFESVFNDVGGFKNAETQLNNAFQAVPDDAAFARLSTSIVAASILGRFYFWKNSHSTVFIR